MYGNDATSDDFLSFNFPTTALASFDDDFLSLLQKHTKSLNPQPAQSHNPAQQLSTFPNPTITPPSSGTDESPSPPNVNNTQDLLSRNPSSSAIVHTPMSARATRSSNRDSQSDILALGKRKAPYLIDDDDDDDDDLEIHPPHKQLHTDTPGVFSPFGPCLPLILVSYTGSSAKKSSKRKSGGNAQVRPYLTSRSDYRSIDTRLNLPGRVPPPET